MYTDRGQSSVNLREQFVLDLISVIRDFQLRGHDIVLMTDVNEASRHGSAVDWLIYACHLSDVHAKCGTTPPPATYHRGTDKIDFVLVSARLAPMVTAAAILGLHDGYLSDHRALLVDFDAQSLFMGVTSPVVAPSARRLTSTNPIAVHTYVENMLIKIERHGLAAKVFTLQQISECGQWTEEQVREWESIDWILEEARISSERKCKAKKSGSAPWSPALKITGKSILYWRTRLCEITSSQASNTWLANLAKSIGLAASETESQSYQEMRAQLKKARMDHSAAKQEAAALREEFLRERGKFLAATQGMSEHAACAAIEARERSSRQFWQLRQIFQRGASSGMERIDVPNSYAVLRQGEEIPRSSLVVKEEIEDVLVPHTVKRFCQHTETPFGEGERQKQLGLDCTSTDASDIMNGTYDQEIDNLSTEASMWLK